MSGTVSFGGAAPAGAGRSFDLTWPGRFNLVQQVAVPVAAQAFGRQAGVALGFDNTTASAYVAGGANWFVNYKGRGGGYQIYAGPAVAGNGASFFIGALAMWPSIGDAAVDEGDPADDFLCWRSYAILSLVGGTIAQDNGVQWVPDSASLLILDGRGGFGFQQTAAGEVSFIRRPANAGVLSATVVRATSAADLAKWHSYEVRIIGASSTSRARLVALIDGRPVYTGLWLTDATLISPIVSAAGTQYGLAPVITSRSGAGMFVHRVRTMAAPSEAGLL